MNEDKFDYTYTAPTEAERREIESIKRQYISVPKEDDKLNKLRRLNKRVTLLPTVSGISIGTIGTLILGLGMTMVIEWGITVWGAIVGIVGAAVAAVAYPIYKAILKRNKRKYAKQIIDLSNELLNSGK